MKTKALNTCKEYNIQLQNRHIIAALSGGSDSTALLHFLYTIKDEFGFTLTAAHINHGIRGEEADRDESFAVSFCSSLNIPIKVLRVSIPDIIKETGESSEEAGRRVRYEFLQSIDEKALIATAHNLDDCIETFLLNLTRGTGLKGLTGIPPVRDNIIRPLIRCTKSEINEYCKQNGIPFVTDSTNLTDDYNRNKIRNNVIPVLQSINPSFRECFLRCTDTLTADEKYLSEETEKYLSEAYDGENGYKINVILSAPESLRNRIVFSAVHALTGTVPEKNHIISVSSFLKDGGSENLNGGKTVISDKKHLKLKSNKKLPAHSALTVNNIPAVVQFADKTAEFTLSERKTIKKINKEVFNYLIDCDRIIYPITVRTKTDGDKFRPQGRNVTKSLKKLFCENHYTPEQKNNAIIIADKQGIICADGFGADERFKITDNTEKILEIKIRRAKK